LQGLYRRNKTQQIVVLKVFTFGVFSLRISSVKFMIKSLQRTKHVIKNVVLKRYR